MTKKASMLGLSIIALWYLLILTSGCSLIKSNLHIQTIENISPKEAYELMEKNKNNPDFLILDVRTPQEFLNGHLENAINLDYYSESFEGDINKLFKGYIYIVYCKRGGRSEKAVAIMKDLRFSEVYNMLGGITQWQSEGLPIDGNE